MKKGNFILFISIIFSFLIIIGCSTTDDDDNGNQITEPPFTEEDSDYFLQVVGGLGRDAYSIMLVKYQGANIDSLELLIDSIPVFLQYNDTLFAWVGGWDLTVTQTYNFDVSINESNWNFDLAVPTVPVITWPEWQPPEEVTLEWALDPDMNNMLQTIVAFTFDEEYNLIDDKVTLVPPEAREFTLPDGWLTVDLTLYQLILAETNYYFQEGLMAVIVNQEMNAYFTGTPPRDNTVEVLKRICRSIK